MKSIEKNGDGSIKVVKVEVLPDYDKKLKGYIHWVSKDCALNVTMNLYSVLFKLDNVMKAGDKWLDHLNPESLVVKTNSKIWNLHKNDPIESRYQFERLGYFMIDKDSNPKKGKIVMNRIVELKESKEKFNNV